MNNQLNDIAKIATNAKSLFYLKEEIFMKAIRLISRGTGVHKGIIVITINITNEKNGVTKYTQETFSTLLPNLLYMIPILCHIDYKCFDTWKLIDKY